MPGAGTRPSDADPDMSGRPSGPPRPLVRRLAALALFVAAVALLMSSDPLFAFMRDLMTEVEPLMVRHRLAGAVIFMALAAVSAFLAFFSSTLLVPVAVHAWGASETMLLLWGGWVLGGAIAYGLGRSLGRPVARFLAGEERLAYYETRIGQGAPFGLVLLLHLALQSEVPGLLLGLLRYRFHRFLLALGIAEIPYAVGIVYGSRFFLERQTGLLLAAAVAAVGVAAWAFRALHRTIDADDQGM